MSRITTHVLDLAAGIPAHGVEVRLDRILADGSVTPIGAETTDDDGRARSLLPNDMRASEGRYRLTFEIADYWHARGVASFFPIVTIEFDVLDPGSHYHVPLLMSPFAYSTYRGS